MTAVAPATGTDVTAASGLRVRGLTAAHRRRGVPALHDVDLDLGRGEMVAVLGPNGCGKSTMLKSLCGVIRPRSGSVVADGRDLSAVSPSTRAALIGYVPQHDDGVGRALTVAESMGLALDRRALGRDGTLDRIIAIAYRLGLAGMLGRRAHELSGGQQQRVLIGRTLAARTPYLLMDEPVSALDLRYQLEIMGLLHELVRSDGVAVLIVLHDLNLAAGFCDRVIVMDEGRIRRTGSPAEVITTDLVDTLYGPVAEVVRLHDAPYVVPARRDKDS